MEGGTAPYTRGPPVRGGVRHQGEGNSPARAGTTGRGQQFYVTERGFLLTFENSDISTRLGDFVGLLQGKVKGAEGVAG